MNEERDWGGEFNRLDQMAMADPLGLRDYAYDLTVGYDQVVTECERLREAMAEQTRKHRQWVQGQMDARIEALRFKAVVIQYMNEFYVQDRDGERLSWPSELERLVDWSPPEED